MISFDAFIEKYDKKFLDPDGMYGRQCVEAVREFFLEVLDLPWFALPIVTYAKHMFTRFIGDEDDNFVKVVNNGRNTPPRGSVLVWDYHPPLIGVTGHVALCISVDHVARTVEAFGQNLPTGSPCHKQTFSLDEGLLGWFIPKKFMSKGEKKVKTKQTMLFVPTEHDMVGQIRASSLNSEFEVVFPHEMSYDDYLLSVANADIVVVDMTEGTRIGAAVLSLAIEHDVPFIITSSKYTGNVVYKGIDDLVAQVKEIIKKL